MNKLFLICVLLFAFYLFKDKSVVLEDGVTVMQAPLQENINKKKSFPYKDYFITPLADFSLKAKVLSRKDYSSGKESELSPTDLALGWQNMSDEKVLRDIDITQSGRWYRWSVEKFIISRKEIETQSANMHIIPEDDRVESLLNNVRQGEIIQLKGYLVEVNDTSNWKWRSSLTRNDTGGHACEVFYVQNIEKVPSL